MVVDSEIRLVAITLRRYLTPLQLTGFVRVVPSSSHTNWPPLLRGIQIESCTAYKIVIKHHGKERATIVTAENHIDHLNTEISSAGGPQI